MSLGDGILSIKGSKKTSKRVSLTRVSSLFAKKSCCLSKSCASLGRFRSRELASPLPPNSSFFPRKKHPFRSTCTAIVRSSIQCSQIARTTASASTPEVSSTSSRATRTPTASPGSMPSRAGLVCLSYSFFSFLHWFPVKQLSFFQTSLAQGHQVKLMC